METKNVDSDYTIKSVELQVDDLSILIEMLLSMKRETFLSSYISKTFLHLNCKSQSENCFAQEYDYDSVDWSRDI